MRSALLRLAEDFLSTIVFLAVYLPTGALLPAVGAAIAVGLARVALLKWRRRPVDAMQGLSLGLVVAFGAAALITDDSRFMMAKPSVIHFAVGAVMLRPGWMIR
jgi:intracellular septation protein